ncbi:MAG: hypothetical protein MJY71_02610 [Bacteroidaceae bacterium]|nr:hypothetical protein [Bacteroidaceae bacterium]
MKTIIQYIITAACYLAAAAAIILLLGEADAQASIWLFISAKLLGAFLLYSLYRLFCYCGRHGYLPSCLGRAYNELINDKDDERE